MPTIRQIFDKNRNLLQRVKKEKVRCKYLPKEDVLLFSIGSPKRSITRDIEDGLILVHFHPKTLKITGFTFPYFQAFIEKCEGFENLSIIKRKKKHRRIRKKEIDSITSTGMNSLSFATQ